MSLNTSTGNNKFNIPEGIIELPLKPFKVSNAKNILIISDTHFPYHDKKAQCSSESYDCAWQYLLPQQKLDYNIPDKSDCRSGHKTELCG